MPRVDSGIESGLYVPGVYRALLDRERERNARDERLAARMMRERGFCYHRNRRLAELLEAGESVVLRRAAVECALWFRDRPPRPARLPLDRSIRFVEVSPDDRITPTADLA